MSVLEIALKSAALALAEEVKAYDLSPPAPPDTNDPKEVLAYLKTVASEVAKLAGGSVVQECLEVIEKFLNGEASEEDLKLRCPKADELPEGYLDPFKSRFFGA